MADAEGLERLSMRRLGERLGVEAMSLYHHVPNKPALMDAMVDQVFAEMAVPEGDDWRAGLRARAVSHNFEEFEAQIARSSKSPYFNDMRKSATGVISTTDQGLDVRNPLAAPVVDAVKERPSFKA